MLDSNTYVSHSDIVNLNEIDFLHMNAGISELELYNQVTDASFDRQSTSRPKAPSLPRSALSR